MTIMDANLVGYLLNALDPETHREVEDYLRGNPEARQRLETLRRGLTPLAADKESPHPPVDLVLKTLAFVAEHRNRSLPEAPCAPTLRFSPATRRGWRRPDVLVAAGLLIAVCTLLLPVRNKLLDQSYVRNCQNNLRLFHQAMSTYSDLHDGAFPRVETQPRRNFAGVVVQHLNDQGVLPPQVSVNCPPNSSVPPQFISFPQLEMLSPESFEHYAGTLGGDYAYSLGYRDAQGRYQGLRRDANSPNIPIMADRPPESGWGNSLNHGGGGQNVLYSDGSVRFVPTRTAGVNGDDIYVNKLNKVAPGLDPFDTVLAPSPARP